MNNTSLEKLYAQYSSQVYSYAFSLCKNYHDAQELVSETFFRALISLDKEEGNFKYWLLRVCKNIWLDGIRKKKYISDTPIQENIAFTEAQASYTLFKDVEKKILYESIQCLPQTYKEIIILYYFCELSLKEIAKIMEISPGASRMLISRARKYLKERLNEEDFL